MTLSVIINARNEGGRVAATCRAFLDAGADEVILCADGTTDGSCDALPPRTRVVRHAKSQGCGKAKMAATALATGDVLCWVDAHQTVHEGDLRAAAAVAHAERVILCPALVNIRYDEHWQPYLMEGARRFYPNNDALLTDAKQQYRLSPEPGPLRMVGVGLLMSRATWLAVGGWNRYRGCHGSQERGMALRALMAGVPVQQLTSLVMGHEFYGTTHPSRNASTGQYRFNNVVPGVVNAWHAFRTVLSPSAFESARADWLPAGGDLALTLPEAAADHSYFHRHCKTRPDARLIEELERTTARRTNPAPPDPGGAKLEPCAERLLRSLARGRCLELGTGSGTGTRALLGSCLEVISVDHLAQFATAAREGNADERACFLHVPRSADSGFYDMPGHVHGLFDTIIIDGPPGTAARRAGIRTVLPLLAPGGIILVDDAHRDHAHLEADAAAHGLRLTRLPTRRGMARLERAAPPE